VILPAIGTVVHTLGHAFAERTSRAIRSAATRERKLRIGVDIRPFYEPLTGIGWYLYHLLHQLARYDDVELLLFGDARITDEGPHLHADLPQNARMCAFDLRGEPKSAVDRPLTAAAYVGWIALSGCDVIFGANYFLPRLMGAVARRRVITIHDLTYKRYPELLQQETLQNLERQMGREIALADAIICVSQSTRDDLLHFYEVDQRRVYAIHSGIAPLPQPAPIPGLPQRYILFVSTIEPRKNLGVLLDAFAQIRDEYEGSLVVAGKVGWKSEEIAERLTEPRVVHLDYLPQAQLATVYANADLFVFPSIYEGFGFPMLEAMAQGVPVIAARSSSLPEVGGDAALYFDPRDANELAALIRRVMHDGMIWQALIARGRERAAEFRWELTAELTLEVLRSVV
jgi:glycosyltransferase involved in cell wall biosynthesis